MFRRSMQTVSMGLLRVIIPNFPLKVLESIMSNTVERYCAREEHPDWDRQEACTLLWQKRSSEKEILRGYVLQTWDAISQLCSFERLVESGSPDKYAFGPWLSSGKSGDLIVVLPPVTIRHR
jgi:hypothetical protein